MKKILNLSIVFIGLSLCLTFDVNAQGVGINPSGNPPDNSAMLDVSSTNKGLLIPRVTTAERTSISTPATGLMVYDTNTNSFWYYNGTSWTEIGGSSGGSATIDLQYPEGFTGMVTIVKNNLSTTNYTVPSGKHLYITQVLSVSENRIMIDGKNITEGKYNWQDGTSYTNTTHGLFNPIIVDAGSVVSTNNNEINFLGFTIDATTAITPLSINNFNSSPYTVPPGKRFVILNYYGGDAYPWFKINNVEMFFGSINRGATRLQIPMVLTPGTVISHSCCNGAVVNGYLMDN